MLRDLNLAVFNPTLLQSYSQYLSLPPLKPIPCLNSLITTETLAWSDGGKNSSHRFCAGFISDSGKSKTYLRFQIVGPQNSFEAEAQAVEAVLLSHSNTQSLTLFIDNKGLVETLLQIQKQNAPSSQIKPKSISIMRIIELMRARQTNRQKTTINHIFSHLLDKPEKELSDKKAKHLKEMKKRYPNSWHKILQGNQEIDKYISETETQPDEELSPLTAGLGNYVLINRKYGAVLENLGRLIKNILLKRMEDSWKRQCPKKTEPRFNPLIDWPKTIQLINDPKYFSEHKERALFRAIYKLYPLNKHMLDVTTCI